MNGAESDWLFLARHCGPLSRQRIYNLIQQLGEKAGLSLCSHPHMLRHACGFALADRGVDTRLIQDYLGHRNIRHTVRYTASNAERFEGVWRSKGKRKRVHLGPNCNDFKPNPVLCNFKYTNFPLFIFLIVKQCHTSHLIPDRIYYLQSLSFYAPVTFSTISLFTPLRLTSFDFERIKYCRQGLCWLIKSIHAPSMAHYLFLLKELSKWS